MFRKSLLAGLLLFGVVRGLYCTPTTIGKEDIEIYEPMSTQFSSGPLFSILCYLFPWIVIVVLLFLVLGRLGRHIGFLQYFRDRDPTKMDHKTDWCDCAEEHQRYKQHLAESDGNVNVLDARNALMRRVYLIKGSPDY